MNELEANVTVDYQAGKLELLNAGSLQRRVKEVADKYSGLIITDETVKADKKTKVELNSLLKQLEEKRKEYKKDYQIPLKQFEQSIKDIEKPLVEVIDNLKGQLDEYDVKVAKAKEEEIRSFINETCQNHEADANNILINPKWLNKSTSKKTWQDEVIQAIKLEDAETIRRNQDRDTVIKFAKQFNVSPDAYLYQLDNGSSAVEIAERMEQDAKREQARKEAIKAQEEAERVAKAERTKTVGNKQIDTETGEVEELETYNLTITGKHDDLVNLAKYMQEHDITFKTSQEFSK